MNKIEIDDKIKEFYSLNETLEEEVVKKEHKKLYKEVLVNYGSWEKALRVNNITKRRLKEREKFFLYAIMKRRYEKHGREALRPKNVDLETKEKIVDIFKTLKAVKEIIKNWNEDKIMYELRENLMTGSTINDIEKTNKELHEQIMYHYKDINEVIIDYNRRFVPLEMIEEEKEKVLNVEEINEEINEETDEMMNEPQKQLKIHKKEEPKVSKTTETKTKSVIEESQSKESEEEGLIAMLKEVGLISEETVSNIIKAKSKTKEEVISYLFEQIAETRRRGERLTENDLKEKNEVMYYALKTHFKSLKNAFDEIKRTIIEIG